jgi:hypothetical protein
MDRKTRLPVDSIAIKALIKEKGYNYKRIEEASGGEITETKLKDMLNTGGKTDEDTLGSLAVLLNCEKNDLIDKDYLLSVNLSLEVNSIIQNLYRQNKSDNINRYYASEIKKFRTNVDLEQMLNEAHRLFLHISSNDYIFDKTGFVKAFNIIGKDFVTHNSIANRELTEIQGSMAKNLYSKIIDASGEYNIQQVLLMFLYVFILYDAIFLEEEVASVVQLVPERKTEKADQFYELAHRSEKMRDALIDFVVYKDVQFDTKDITEYCLDEPLLEGITLMLTACEKCYLHIHGNFVDSEYINRAAFSAILRKLEKIFIELGIKLPEDNSFFDLIKMNNTRFGRYYNMLKSIFVSLNPPRKPKDKFLSGYIMGKFSQ